MKNNLSAYRTPIFNETDNFVKASTIKIDKRKYPMSPRLSQINLKNLKHLHIPKPQKSSEPLI